MQYAAYGKKTPMKTLQNMKIAINLFRTIIQKVLANYELILQHFHYQIDKQYTYNNSDTLLNDIKIFVTINWLTKVGYFCSSLLK